MKNTAYLLFPALVIAGISLAFIGNKDKKNIGTFVYIPERTILSDAGEELTLDPFYILDHEVTVEEYSNFLKESGNHGLAIYDSLLWRDKLSDNEIYVENYYNHPAFKNHPINAISKKGALLYCNWLEKKLEAELGKKIETNFTITLPTKGQWVCAAQAGYELMLYPWTSPYLHDDKYQNRCNYNGLGAEHITYNYETGTYHVETNSMLSNPESSKTMHVRFYEPNPYKIYEMSGNVSEMILNEDIAMGGSFKSPGGNVTIQSEMPFTKPSIEVGFRPVLILKN